MTDKTDRPVPEQGFAGDYPILFVTRNGGLFLKSNGERDYESDRMLDKKIEESRINELRRIQAKFAISEWARS